MKNQNSTATIQNRGSNFASWFLLSAGGILALNGTSSLLGVFGKSSVMDLTDPVLGISFRHLLLFAGIIELIVAFLCLFTNKGTLALGLIAWLAVNFAVYRVGLWTMSWHHPYAWLAGLMGGLDISPLIADGIVAVILAYLLIGGIAMLWVKRRTIQTKGFLKMSCVSCDGHVEFPAHALGQKIPCPHCEKTITLLNPA
jgi:hypothetical protein